jgi:LysR family transcriptional regulator, glycine cleavage system transcriptional activator
VSVVDLQPREPSRNPLEDRRAVPPFAALRAFEALGRTGGLRRAAQSLGLNHGVVSRHIRALEAWTGVQLVERSSAERALTPAGALYHARLSAALFEVASATADLIGARDDGRFSLWCAPGFASKWLSARLGAFEAANLDLEIELHPTDAGPNFERREADADIRYVPFGADAAMQAKGCRALEIARPPVSIVASPELIARFPRLGTLEDLLKAPLIHEESDDQWRAWFQAHETAVSDNLPGPRLWNAHLAVDGARRGQGLALANSFLIEDDLAQGSLVTVDVGRKIALGAYVFVARSDQWSSSSVVRFRRWLHRAVAQPGAGVLEAPGA